MLEITGMLYFVIQDIINIKHIEQYHNVTDEATDIPFVDRKELLENILLNTYKKIKNHDFYVNYNIKYERRNGKTSLSKRVCKELIRIRDNNLDFDNIDSKFRKQIGNVFFLDYKICCDSFEKYVKTEFRLIKGKKNIIVVHNDFYMEDYWNSALQDPDVFYVRLNYVEEAEDLLAFQNDKIEELLEELKKMPRFSNRINTCGISINQLANRLGMLSNNNIGNIVSILTSEDFEILIETDSKFIDFYLALKNADYTSAESYYSKIVLPEGKALIYNYKLKFEHANLMHFLGDYIAAIEELEDLKNTLETDKITANLYNGQKLYLDLIILLSHVYKHIGRFDFSRQILFKHNYYFENILWLRSNFSINIFRMNELSNCSAEWRSILKETETIMQKFVIVRSDIKNSDYYFYETYYPIIKFYSDGFNINNIDKLIDIVDKAIIFYENNERRYLTNCLFIKAEFLRICGDFKNALRYYQRCYDIYLSNGDKDILYLIAITSKYVKNFYNWDINIINNLNDVIDECVRQNDVYRFHNNLITDLDKALYAGEDAFKEVKEHYFRTITPIP